MNNGKLSLPAAHKSSVKVASMETGSKMGSSIPGFGGGKSSTMGHTCETGHKPGTAVAGFSGGVKNGKV